MGDPRKLRKKYTPPSHPWQKLRIDGEKELMKEYGFKNKVELWKLSSKLSDFKRQVKNLITKHDETSERQKSELILRLQKLNLIGKDAVVENILEITLKDMCERRLQTVVFKKGLARSIGQSRQFITHEHILLGEKKITSPSYIVGSEEEAKIKFSEGSALESETHPERVEVKPLPKLKKDEAVEKPAEQPKEEPAPEQPAEEEKPAEKEEEKQEVKDEG